MAIPPRADMPPDSEGHLRTPEAVHKGAILEIIDSVPKNSTQERALADYRALRTQFVLDMNWFKEEDLPEGGDFDFYDQLNDPENPGLPDPENWHTDTIIARDEREGEIVAGARFTRIPSVEDSLSWSMLPLEMKEQVSGDTLRALDEKATDNNLFDLTRLVHPLDDSKHKATIIMGMLKIFGAGVAKTCEASGDDNEVTWVYTTTPDMYILLDGLGVKQELLAKADVPDVTGESEGVLFCSVDVMDSLNNIQSKTENAFAAKHIERGLQEAQAQ